MYQTQLELAIDTRLTAAVPAFSMEEFMQMLEERAGNLDVRNTYRAQRALRRLRAAALRRAVVAPALTADAAGSHPAGDDALA